MVKITETVLRDGHQSLIATRMSTPDMLPILDKLDRVGYFSMEVWGGATFDVCMRFLNEDPWERLREIRKRITKTKLQMLLRGQNLVAYRHHHDDIVVKFVEKARDNGIDIFRIFDAVNDIRNMTTAIKTAKKVGAIVEGSISYTVSPIHTIEKYVKFAYELKDAGSDIICIKDMSGIISPVAAYDLVNALKKEVKLPIHLHSHCSSGMAPVTYLTACEAGVDILDTAISPFGWGTSQPPTESIVGSLNGTPFDTKLDMALLVEIADYFQKVKEKYKSILDPISERVDPKILVHQIPGGMISNLISQLKEQHAMDKYDEVLKETARVRKELGYPPLVTPTSQIVGTQAVFNVISSERYKIVSKEVKDYVRGLYGRPPGPIDEDVKKKVIGDEEPIQSRPADSLQPEWPTATDEARKLKPDATDEDILAYAIFPYVAKAFWRSRSEVPTVASGEKRAEPAPLSAEAPKTGPDKTPAVSVTPTNGNYYTIELDARKYQVNISAGDKKAGVIPLAVEFDGKRYDVNIYRSHSPVRAAVASGRESKAVPLNIPMAAVTQSAQPSVQAVQQPTVQTVVASANPDGHRGGQTDRLVEVKVPMPGKIVSINVKPGDKVKKGVMLLILEAMKMQNEIDSPCEGTINQITANIGDSVENNATVIKIVPA